MERTRTKGWVVGAIVAAVLAVVAAFAAAGGAPSADPAFAAPDAGQTCKAAKGTLELSNAVAGGGTGTISGSIDGAVTYEVVLQAGDDEWGPRSKRMLEVTPKSGPTIHLTMQETGTNWTSQKVIAGGWIGGGRSGVDYYLSMMIEAGPNIPTEVWTYAGLVCTGPN